MKKYTVREKFGRFVQQLIQPESSRQSIALSFSLGTLIAILPTPGFGILLGLLLILIFRSLNRIAMILAITLWNPLLQLPVYYVSYWLGSILLGNSVALTTDESWMTLLTHHTKAFVVGNTILAALISVVSYILVMQLVGYHRRRKAIAEILNAYRLPPERAQSV
ncbi:MAG: DUF2062 domain-containing protein [Bacteroidota bacterium]